MTNDTNNSFEKGPTPPTMITLFGKKFSLVTVLSVIIILFAVAGSFVVYKKSSTPPSFEDALLLSNLGTDPKPLQNYFAEQVAVGNKDDATKSALFWITHRFFDNGGNIYEIYDFVNEREEVAFLKKAETLDPEAFKLVKDKKAQPYDAPSFVVLLSYFEIARRDGYANFAMLGLGANKYAEMAYYDAYRAFTPGQDKEQKKKLELLAFMNLGKSRAFYRDAIQILNEATKKTGKLSDLETGGMRIDDIVVGLNQIATAQAFYRYFNESMDTKFLTGDIFSYNVDLTRRLYPRLYFFTNYSWAASNVIDGTTTPFVVSEPLTNVIAYGRANKGSERPAGSLLRVINARTNREKSTFSVGNAVRLGNSFKPFKDWLIENGWKETDFR